MRLTLDIRNDAFSKLNRLPMKYFISEPSGKVVTKITSDSEGVRGLYQVHFFYFNSCYLINHGLC